MSEIPMLCRKNSTALAPSILSAFAAALFALPGLTQAGEFAPLSYEVFVSDGVQRATLLRLPSGDPVISSPISSILIFGRTDAVLVDPPMTRDQTAKVADWIAESGKRLKFIYATHGHGDHWFGTAQLLQRFPGATVYATPGTIALMRKQATEGREQVFDKSFPGLIGDTTVLAQSIPDDGFLLEGNVVRAIQVGHSDTDDTTVLYVPSIGLVAAGDVAYNGVHQYLLEGGHNGLAEWIAAIDKVEALKPRIVVAGHKQKSRPDDPAILEETRRYLEDAERILATKPTPRAYYDQMIAFYPDRINPGPLWYSGIGLLVEQQTGAGSAIPSTENSPKQ
jgi:glyoxylase-like metal-dependent hydrolase (beta-lactamase superfamily II)